MRKSMRPRGLIANTSYSIAEKLVISLGNLLLIPFVLKHIGVNEYGTWVLLLSIASYFLLAQFGLSASFEKFISEYQTNDDFEGLNKIVCTSFYSLLFIGIILVASAYYLYPLVASLMAKHAYIELHRFFMLLMLVLAIGLLQQVFVAIPKGFLRYDIASTINIFIKFIEILFVIVFLKRNFGIYAMLYSLGISSSIGLIAYIAISLRIIKGLNLWPVFFSFQMLKKLYRFGIHMQVGFLAMWVAQHLDKIVIGKFAGASYVGMYEIGAKLLISFRNMFSLVFHILIPKISQMSAQGRSTEVINVYTKGTKIAAFASLSLIAIVHPIAQEILNIWLRSPVEPFSVYVLQVLAVGISVNLTTGVGSSVLRGKGIPAIETIANTFVAIINIIFSLLLYFYFGINGVVWGTVIALTIGAIYFLCATNKILEQDNRRFFLDTYFPAISIAAVLITIGHLIVEMLKSVALYLTDNEFWYSVYVAGTWIALSLSLIVSALLIWDKEIVAKMKNKILNEY
jgi:O-antigen/teichoic acid export membrane protein